MRTYYKDNPKLGIRTVTTASGDTEYRVNCRNIKGNFYTIDIDCFLVGDKWMRKDSGLIDFDYETKEWYIVKSTSKRLKGIVDFKDGKPVYGNFTPNPYNNCQYCSGYPGDRAEIVINQDVLIQNKKIEDFSTGIWYSQEYVKVKDAQTPRNAIDHTSKGYNIEDNKEEFKLKQLLFANYKPVLSKDVVNFAHILGDTTFGLELECSHGNLPNHVQNRLGVVICRDGSLKDENGHPGPEFVTVPLSGAKGLQTVNSLSKELTKRTKLNLNCSFHIHFGTIDTSRVYLVTLFRLCNKLQNEIFQMFPYYKANPEGVKNKNYNKKLPGLGIVKCNEQMSKDDFEEYVNSNYKQIFSWLAEGYQPDRKRNRKNKKHPAQAKWDRHERYYWVNFMNTIFSERNTIEFRLHGPTTNAQKMINWLFICNAILKYAMNNSHKILLTNCAISINDVLDYYKNHGSKGEFLAEYLKAYVAERKKLFLLDYKKGDRISEWDYIKDDEYVFTYNNVTNLF